MTFDLWSLWLELLGSSLDLFLDELHRSRPDLAAVLERAFDAERVRLDCQSKPVRRLMHEAIKNVSREVP